MNLFLQWSTSIVGFRIDNDDDDDDDDDDDNDDDGDTIYYLHL